MKDKRIWRSRYSPPKLRNVQTSPQSHSAIDFSFFFFFSEVQKLCLNFAGVWVKNKMEQHELKMTHLLKHSVTLRNLLFTQSRTGSRIKTCCLVFMAMTCHMTEGPVLVIIKQTQK